MVVVLPLSLLIGMESFYFLIKKFYISGITRNRSTFDINDPALAVFIQLYSIHHSLSKILYYSPLLVICWVKMLKFLLRFCVCISIMCYSAIINDSQNGNFENDFNLDLLRLKQIYFGKIAELKQNATNYALNGSFFNMTAKIEVSFCWKYISWRII